MTSQSELAFDIGEAARKGGLSQVPVEWLHWVKKEELLFDRGLAARNVRQDFDGHRSARQFL